MFLFTAGGIECCVRTPTSIRLNAPAGSTITSDFGSCCPATPPDSDLKPQTVNEIAAGVEYEVLNDLTLGLRGVYRAQGSVIEDGSFDEGNTFFLFNPGESATERWHVRRHSAALAAPVVTTARSSLPPLNGSQRIISSSLLTCIQVSLVTTKASTGAKITRVLRTYPLCSTSRVCWRTGTAACRTIVRTR